MTEHTTADVEVLPETISEEVIAPDLTINDLLSTQAIIDLASSRGVFKPEEMEAVGTAYTKLSTFLAHVQQASAEAEPAAEADAA
jgi:hypothetical protein